MISASAGTMMAAIAIGAARPLLGMTPSPMATVAGCAIAGLVTFLAAEGWARSRRSVPPGLLVRARRATVVVVSVAAVVAVLGGILYVATPGVGDAGKRVRAQAAAHHVNVPHSPIPHKIAAALVSTEDSRFFTNPGVDLPSVARATYGALRGGRNLGGSTLEQQLVKQLYTAGHDGHLDQVEQVVLAVKLDHHWSKPKMLRMYLATVYFGHGYWGLDAAARGYFHTSPEHLDWPQAALLVGLVQAPSADDPLQHPQHATARRAEVLHRLAVTKILTSAQARHYANSPLELAS
ncbi:biosynthetic peptidoglycan transglycosylase [Streptomyces silvisoli]|uniref:Transglycosylase domain-containing protein n=1 Tax=Streptomyces silvisoli TaxID=3034235 RepID=A0ABT5ZP30_9ACTN|nr:biosynthetic peptidoglycan transglycosylase [Streptomyces silvisoli]MDF3291568.1 transglycosylase domain-containing protein [Streptomyces silvisoli]